jgi:hypothetical protein
MTRKTDIRRDSRPKSPELFADRQQKAELEARNGLLQFDAVVRLIAEVERAGKFKLRPSTIQELQRIAIQDIYNCAGNYRTGPVTIQGTDHQPPSAPGTLTIPDQIVEHRDPYYAALDAADLAWGQGRLDVTVMEDLLSKLLARQLIGVHAAAAGQTSHVTLT